MNPRSGNLLFCAIGFVLGLVCFKVLESPSQLVFDPTFNFGNVIWAVTTLLVAGVLATYLQRQTQSDRSEKELLLRHLDQVLNAVTEFEKFKEGGHLTAVNASLKTLSMKCQSIHGILVDLKCPPQVIESARFDTVIRAIRKLATETPIKQIEKHANSASCSSEVRDGIISLASEKRSLLDNKIQDMKTRILKAQLKINKM